MRILRILLALLLSGALLGCQAWAAEVSDEQAAAQVSVTRVTLDPAVFFEGDTGTITLEVTNSGTQSVALHRATLYDQEITLVSNPYDSIGTLGGGNKMEFTFTVKADAPEGIYYPAFSLSFRDAGSLRYPVKLQVENIPLSISVIEKPDTFSEGRKDEVQIAVGNPRDNAVNGVNIVPRGTGFDVIPSGSFIGMLEPDRSTLVPFMITPHRSTDLIVRVDYKNGVNLHNASITIPVHLLESKKMAVPVLSNIQLRTEAGIHHLTGDVTNTGLEEAKSVVITPDGDVLPVDPFKAYPVGSLKPDDFASFEVTFRSETTSQIPITVTFKDADGNPYVQSTLVDVPVTATGTEGPSDVSPWAIVAVAIVAVVIAGVIVYSWRRR